MKRLHDLLLTIVGMMIVLAACQKAPELTLTGPASLEISADGGSGSITFTANRDWSVRSSDSWVSVTPSSGSASDGTVTLSIRCENTTYEDRTATVTITMEELSQTVTVKQPANLGIVIPSQSFNLASDARSIEVEVQSNVQYTVSISDNWIKQTGTKGLTTNKLTFSVDENTTYDARSATITIKPQNATVQEQVISVKQAQKDALIVKDTSFDMPYGGGEIEVKVEANVSFDVKPSEDWIHYVETKALSSSTVRLTVDENETYSNREGKIEIKQKNGTLSHTLTVKQAGRIAVTSIELNKTSLTLKEGASETLTATVKPDNATDKTVTWSSSAPDIASVDEAGNVTAVAKGEATITAQAGEKTAKCTVSVYKEIPVTSVELDKNALSLVVGDEATLKATVKPDDTTFKTVTWTSSNASIATVDENGKVVAVAKGNATITAKAGDKEAVCTVFIKAADYKAPSGAVDLGLSVDWAKSDYNMPHLWDLSGYFLWGDPTGSGVVMDYVAPDLNNICDTQYDIARVKLGKGWRLPTRAEVEELLSSCVWQESSSGAWLYGPNGQGVLLRHTGIAMPSDGPVGSVSLTSMEKGFILTGESQGSGNNRMAFVYQFDKNFSYGLVSYNAAMAKFPVRPVYESLDGTIPVSSISLNKTDLSLKVGDSETLVATVKPDDATDKRIAWNTSDASVASVDDSGMVTAQKVGVATITALVGDLSATCHVTVQSESRNVPEGAIDLGMSILWATKNLGAPTPEDFGNRYAWGEVNTKEDFSATNYAFLDWNNYRYYNNVQFLKYNKLDGKKILDRIDDAASVNLGGKWRMPTEKELSELFSGCHWERGSTGRVGEEYLKGTSYKTGETIIIPAQETGGTGKPYTIKLMSSEGNINNVSTHEHYVNNDSSEGDSGDIYEKRYEGFYIRPVYDPSQDDFVPVSSISLDKTELTLKKGETASLVATVMPANATDKTVLWSSPDWKYATVDQSGKVTAWEKGTVDIEVYACGKTATCKVTVGNESPVSPPANIPVESISLNKPELVLIVGDSENLIATVKPDNATDKTVSWRSSNERIVSVSTNGLVRAEKEGEATITASAGDIVAECSVKVNKKIVVPDAIDLGLKVKWASFNLGASAPEEYGDYYAWGETKTKEKYTWGTYMWCNGAASSLTKYNTSSSRGPIDNKTKLDPDDDVAHTVLGGTWRMPTEDEMQELISQCSWEWKKYNGVYGYQATSKVNGKSLFFPAAGCYDDGTLKSLEYSCKYWTSSLFTDSRAAMCGEFYVSNGKNKLSVSYYFRYYGYPIRPVFE